MLETLLTAVGLYLVLEGIFPFVAPKQWKRTMLEMLRASDDALRICGLLMMLGGVALLYIVR
ncbi:conserved hypothetical protein [gamma proteobacterium HTCC5015]|nr:conserved hypothetical protein [gamma proteobacterium HTCC5015]